MNNYPNDDSTDIKNALRHYPQLHASPEFNRRVLDAMEKAAHSPHRIDAAWSAWCDRLDHLFENRLLKLISTALLGIAISWSCCQLAFHLPRKTPTSFQIIPHQETSSFR